MNDRALREFAASRREPTVVVEVVASRGSAPRDAGTRMLVGANDRVGTVGGGNLEWRAIATARAMLADASVRPADQAISLGASLGQCCGGAVTLRYRVLDPALLAAWAVAATAPVVQVFGAGHVGRAIVRILETLDVRVQWIDERESEFPAEPSAANVERVCVEPVEAEVATAPREAFFLVLTHQHDLDLRIVEAILERGDFAYLGLIGSMTKRRRFEHLLLGRGIEPAALQRMTCPVGLRLTAGKEPSQIAVAVAAQLLPLLEAWCAASAGPAEREATGVPRRA